MRQRKQQNKKETCLTVCERENERLRQRDKTVELMSEPGRLSVWEREKWRGREEKVSVWIVSSEEFMSSVKSHLRHHTASDGCVV